MWLALGDQQRVQRVVGSHKRASPVSFAFSSPFSTRSESEEFTFNDGTQSRSKLQQLPFWEAGANGG